MRALREAVEQKRPAVAAFLEHAEGTLAEGILHLTFQPRHSFFKKSVEMPANLEALQAAVQNKLGQGVQILLGLAERDQPPASPPKEKEAEQRRRLMEEAGNQPAVNAVRQIFGAEITKIQPAGPPADGGSGESDS